MADYLQKDLLLDMAVSYEDFILEIKDLLSEIIAESELPNRSLVVKDNAGEKVTSFSVCVNEPPYPLDESEGVNSYTMTPVLNIEKPKKENLGTVILNISEWLFKQVAVPEGANVRMTSSRYKIIVPSGEKSTLLYVKELIKKRLAVYSTSEKPFGCCSLFEECSDARKCIHENKLYATACSYRHNLEHGRIFYGRNRNA